MQQRSKNSDFMYRHHESFYFNYHIVLFLIWSRSWPLITNSVACSYGITNRSEVTFIRRLHQKWTFHSDERWDSKTSKLVQDCVMIFFSIWCLDESGNFIRRQKMSYKSAAQAINVWTFSTVTISWRWTWGTNWLYVKHFLAYIGFVIELQSIFKYFSGFCLFA